MTITVYGLPAPQGSKSFKGIRGGKAILAESSKAVKPWREAVKWAVREAYPPLVPGPLVSGAVKVNIAFTLPRPRSVRRSRPDRKPDLDKLIRSTLDALVDAGAIEDDARVVEIRAWKTYPGGLAALTQPGAAIAITEASA